MLRLKEARQAIGATQEQIAEHLGVTRVAYTNIENGKRDPDTDTLIALAKRFGVSADFLLGIEKAAQQELDGQVDEFIRRASQLTPENQRKALSYMEFLFEREQARQAPHDAQPVTAP